MANRDKLNNLKNRQQPKNESTVDDTAMIALQQQLAAKENKEEKSSEQPTEQESSVNEPVVEKTPEPAPEKSSEPTAATAPVTEAKEETTKSNISIDGLDEKDKSRLLFELLSDNILSEFRKSNQKAPKNRGRHIVTETGAEYWEKDKKDFRFTIKVPASMAQKFDDVCDMMGCSRNNGLENIVNGYFTKVPQVIANMPEYKPVDYILPFKNNRLNRNGRETLSVFSFCFSTSMIEAVDAECERFGFERSRFFHDCINCMIKTFGEKE